jgi:hypothetical protein
MNGTDEDEIMFGRMSGMTDDEFSCLFDKIFLEEAFKQSFEAKKNALELFINSPEHMVDFDIDHGTITITSLKGAKIMSETLTPDIMTDMLQPEMFL